MKTILFVLFVFLFVSCKTTNYNIIVIEDYTTKPVTPVCIKTNRFTKSFAAADTIFSNASTKALKEALEKFNNTYSK